jgi:hypothetical protein
MPTAPLPGALSIGGQTMKKTTHLRDTALALLKEHRTVEAAVQPFAALLEKDAELRIAIATDYLRGVAPAPPISRRRAGPHRRTRKSLPVPKLPSASQRKANILVSKDVAHEIFKRKLRGGKTLGEIHVNELRAFAQSSAEVATRFLSRGYEDAVDLFACLRLANYCVAADPFVLVKDAIKPSIVVSIFDQARIDAAEEIAASSGRLAQELMTVAITRSQQPEHHPQ